MAPALRPVLVALLVSSCGGLPTEEDPRGGQQVGLPNVARLVCSEDGPELLTPRVRPQRDGVHIVAENRTDRYLYVLVIHGLFEHDLPAGETREVVGPVPPGEQEAGCYSPNRAQPRPDEMVPLEVVDREGLWTSPELECARGPRWALVSDFFDDVGTLAEPEDIARASLRGAQPGDTLARVRYPEEDVPLFGVYRGGRLITTVRMFRPSKGGWVVEGGEGCSEDGLHVEPAAASPGNFRPAALRGGLR